MKPKNAETTGKEKGKRNSANEAPCTSRGNVLKERKKTRRKRNKKGQNAQKGGAREALDRYKLCKLGSRPNKPRETRWGGKSLGA